MIMRDVKEAPPLLFLQSFIEGVYLGAGKPHLVTLIRPSSACKYAG
jgi:hypothetical protein